ncbi:MAG TPA: hypothetical protein VMV46_23250 [Thermoanaerobaculia bacterium]|nr:hypothetical protein [Thermoanaerobaculia bacterium]
MTAKGSRESLAHAIDLLEESYELFLAWAAQGLPGDGAGASDARVREALERSSATLEGLARGFAEHLAERGEATAHGAFLAVLERDAAAAKAVIDLVRAQPRISSQLVDNLNASVHVRALLTDLFLLDQVLRLTATSREAEAPAGS